MELAARDIRQVIDASPPEQGITKLVLHAHNLGDDFLELSSGECICEQSRWLGQNHRAFDIIAQLDRVFYTFELELVFFFNDQLVRKTKDADIRDALRQAYEGGPNVLYEVASRFFRLSQGEQRVYLPQQDRWQCDVGRQHPSVTSSDRFKRVGSPSTEEASCLVLVPGLDEPLPLKDALALSRDWESTNNRRLALIEKKFSTQITASEREELEHLQKLAWAKRELVMPLPIEELDALEKDLRRRGLWQD
jgi:hypothetical protein